LNREDYWEPSVELKRIFEHRDQPEKFGNPFGEKELDDYDKREKCCWYIFGVL
jgi:hypothetical protein